MQPVPVPVLQPAQRARSRSAVLVSADRSFRQRLSETLTGLRWKVREAESGAQAWAEAEGSAPEAVIVDSWLPDLDLAEFLNDFRGRFPQVDLVSAGGSPENDSPRGPYRQELLYAMRRSQDTDTAAWNTAPSLGKAASLPGPGSVPGIGPNSGPGSGQGASYLNPWQTASHPASFGPSLPLPSPPAEMHPDSANFSMPTGQAGPAHGGNRSPGPGPGPGRGYTAGTAPVRMDNYPGSEPRPVDRLPEMIGNGACMLEVSRRIRLVAGRMTPVLIEGPTGSGKELVAEALHRLSTRSRKPFIAINCAAIPEALLEAELFGHTRGAFTGAVQGRIGRIESADGGTLFLDEIGEMPLALQSKLPRFVESCELQRVGENETVKVDVRILAATHRPLAEDTKIGTFRADLYYRLAVFLIRTPALLEHPQDLPLLVDHFMQRMGREAPLKRVDSGAMAKLAAHDWPGNVRELEHVLERAAILAGDEAVLTAREIDFGSSLS